MFDLIREIGQNLSHNRTRTILTGISVAWGILMLIILVSTGRGIVNTMEHNTSENRGTLVMFPGWTSLPHSGYPSGRGIRLTMDDVERIAENQDINSDKVMARLQTDANVVGPHSSRKVLDGVFTQEMNRLEVVKGRLINQMDIMERRKVIVLNEIIAKTLFKDIDPVGQTVESMGLAWTVVGIYRQNWIRSSYVPATTLASVLANEPYLRSITISLEDVSTKEQSDDAESALRNDMARAHNFNVQDKSAVWINNQFSNYLDARAGLNILQIAIWVIGLLSLISGIVGVSNIMFAGVHERTHEIGIRRAIGAKPYSILIQVVLESIAITTLFGYIGVVLGMGVMQIVNEMIKGTQAEEVLLNPTVDLSTAFSVTIVLIICGALAGLFPALKALKVKPVEALRDE